LSLLFQEQNVRNQIANVASLEQNYRLHEALYISGDVSAVKVDQVFLSLKQGQLSLIQAQAGLEASEDSFKIILGLPPGLPVKLDDSLLAPFQLNGPGLTTLQAEMDKFLPEYRELDVAPSLAKLEDGYKRLRSYHQRLNKLIDQVQDELARWEKQIPQASEDEERSARQRQAHKARVEEVERLRADQKKLADAIA